MNGDDPMSAVFDHIQLALRGLKFGHISLIVQDGRVVQVDRFEKVRLPESSRK
ncbi:MAG: YezD family protein [Planctomycetota bacterium]